MWKLINIFYSCDYVTIILLISMYHDWSTENNRILYQLKLPFILLQVVDQISQHHLLKRLSLIHCIFLPPLSKIRCPYVRGFISGLSILFHWSIKNYFTINLDVLSSVLYWWRILEATVRIRLKARGRRLNSRTSEHQRTPDSRKH